MHKNQEGNIFHPNKNPCLEVHQKKRAVQRGA